MTIPTYWWCSDQKLHLEPEPVWRRLWFGVVLRMGKT